MKLFLSAVNLWILGIYTELNKRYFDMMVDRCIRKNMPLCGANLTRLSHRCSRLYDLFLTKEKIFLKQLSAAKREYR